MTSDSSVQTHFERTTPERSFLTTIVKQTIDDFKLSCMDPVILVVNIHTMLIYGILYLWFEFFPYGMKFFMYVCRDPRS